MDELTACFERAETNTSIKIVKNLLEMFAQRQ